MPAKLPPAIRSRDDIDDLLATGANYERRMPDKVDRETFDLQRTQGLLDAVGHPHRGIRTTHVAGSKGKGSVARMIAHVLREATSSRVGLYTSPHLEDLSERIAIDGRPIDDDALVHAAATVFPAVHAVHGTELQPTYYEMLTAIAWIAFREAGCDDVVLETGLGGRLDATNVCTPSLCVITPIEREHTRILGDTIEQIAGEKAGIIKPDVPVVTSARQPALDVIEARASALGAPCYALGRDFVVDHTRPRPGPGLVTIISTETDAVEVVLPAAGQHQAENAAVALRGLLALGLSMRSIVGALRTVRLPGAMELIAHGPRVLIDGAHTPASALAIARTLDAWWPDLQPVLLLGVLEGKDEKGIADPLVARASAVVTTQVDNARAMPAGELARRLRSVTDRPIQSVPDVTEALAAAREIAGPDGTVLATGSLYLAGAVRRLCRVA